MLLSMDLDNQMAIFKIAMKSNLKGVHTPPFIHPFMWQILGLNALLVHAFPEYFKVAKMAPIIVLGSVEDQRAFSTSGFVKGKLQNKLGEHLPLFVQMFTQKLFPYTKVVQIWKDNKH